MTKETPNVSQTLETVNENTSETEKFSYRIKAGAFLCTAAGFGVLAGFGGALAQAKKQDPRHFDAGMIGLDPAAEKAARSARHLQESGAALATRALGYGTLLAFTGRHKVQGGCLKKPQALRQVRSF